MQKKNGVCVKTPTIFIPNTPFHLLFYSKKHFEIFRYYSRIQKESTVLELPNEQH